MKRFSLFGTALLLSALLVASTTHAAADPVAVCKAAKLKAAAKKAAKKLGCHANAVKKGIETDATCLAKAEAAFLKAFANAEKKTDCPGDPDVVEAEVDAFVNATVDAVNPAKKRVFVLPGGFDGNLGGLAGADAKCQAGAAAAGLSGTYKAWLSTAAESAASRLTHATVPYVLVDGTVVADDWADLVDGTIDHVINLTADGTPTSQPVWTSTRPDGSYVGDGDCSGWTTNATGLPNLGREGLTTDIDDDWTESFFQFCDANFLGLYCFQQ